MKKRYQIDQQRAVQQFRRLATEENPSIQMILPMADVVGWPGSPPACDDCGMHIEPALFSEHYKKVHAN